MYWANVFLAKHLSINAFDDFNVAVSVVTLLSTFATLGLEKYALRLVALYMERGNWSRLRGFWQFSWRTILLFSFVLMGVTNVGLTVVLAWHNAESHTATLLYVLFLPAIALCLYLTELITVYGAQILALVLYRLVLPSVFFLLIIGLNKAQGTLTVETVMICFGSAWCLTLLMMLSAAHLTRPKKLKPVKADYQGKRWWLKSSLPLLLSSLLMTLLMTAGPILLAIRYPSPATVAIYAIAMKSSGFLALLGTSTNRYYLPMLMVLVERRDQAGINELLNKRTVFVAGFITVFLCLIGAWGSQILELFGPTFSKGYWTLLISSVGTAFMTLFSDSLYYLQFMSRNRLVIGLLSLAAIGMLTLGYSLGAIYGATGMAIAYALPTMTLFSVLKWQARRHMLRFMAG
ncbi:lipopolysaccharide biosynthesis protein [Methylomonas methanica]|nr:hypothetical protein [Methylomonas methanica]